ncbi:MAG: S41 family peptidase [Acidobacteriota bacterium]
MRVFRSALVLAALLLAAAPARGQAVSCTATGQAAFVRDTLQELYLWYRDVPDLDPARYASPEAYLDAARFRPLDSSFTYITSRAANEALFSDSQFIGLGLSTAVVASELRVLQVFPGSPAEEAGLERGARIEVVDGRAVSVLVGAGAVDSAFGPAQAGLEVALEFTRRSGERRTAVVRKRAVTIPTVSLTRVFAVGGRRVGYLFFRNFVRPSTAALDQAFAALKEAGVSELVLDLRYNGGGLVDVAVHLASLIGGSPLRDQVFAESRHNDRNLRLNETLRFSNPGPALRLDRLIVVATRATASASELVINGLRPYIPVVVVGDRTYGKPVGQYALPFCDQVLAAVSFAMVNGAGQGGYFDGLAADCLAADDLNRDLGSADEASLAAALRFIDTGSCLTPTAATHARLDAPLERTAVSAGAGTRGLGWASLVNAY